MAEIMRMRKIQMLITSVRVKIQLNFHWTVFEKGQEYSTIKKSKWRKLRACATFKCL